MRGRDLGVIVLIVAGAAIGVLGLLGLAHYGGPGGAGAGGALPSCEGFSVLSEQVYSRIDPATGNSVKTLSITGTPNCPGSYFQFTQGSAALQSLTGYSFGTGFTVTAKVPPQQLVYGVSNQKISVREAFETSETFTTYLSPDQIQMYETCAPTPAPVGSGWIVSGYVGSCRDSRGYPIDGPFPIKYVRTIGTKGVLTANPTPVWSVDITLANDAGQSITRTISSTSTRAEWDSDNTTLATATWNGNLLTNSQAPDTGSVVAVYSDGTHYAKGWTLATASDWQLYSDASNLYDASVQAAPLTCYPGQCAPGAVSVSTGPTSATIVGLSSASAQLFASPGTLGVPGQFTADGTGYVISTAPTIQTPVITFLISGEFLGVVAPSGVPSLRFDGVDPSTSPYHAGNPGLLDFTAGNNGNFTAGFSLAATCSGGAQLFPAIQLSIPAHGSLSERVPFTLANPGSYSCTATLTDLTTGSTAAPASAVVALAVQLCQPGQVKLFNATAIQSCSSDGSKWAVSLDCSQPIVKTVTTSGCISPELAAFSRSQGQVVSSTTGEVIKNPDWDTNLKQTNCAYKAYNPNGNSGIVGVGTYDTANDGYSINTSITTSYQPSMGFDPATGTITCSGPDGALQTLKVTGNAPAPAATSTPTPLPVGGAAPAPAGGGGGGTPRPTPGFEAVFAVAGLLAVAWVVSRRREQ